MEPAGLRVRDACSPASASDAAQPGEASGGNARPNHRQHSERSRRIHPDVLARPAATAYNSECSTGMTSSGSRQWLMRGRSARRPRGSCHPHDAVPPNPRARRGARPDAAGEVPEWSPSHRSRLRAAKVLQRPRREGDVPRDTRRIRSRRSRLGRLRRPLGQSPTDEVAQGEHPAGENSSRSRRSSVDSRAGGLGPRSRPAHVDRWRPRPSAYSGESMAGRFATDVVVDSDAPGREPGAPGQGRRGSALRATACPRHRLRVVLGIEAQMVAIDRRVVVRHRHNAPSLFSSSCVDTSATNHCDR